MAAPLVAVGAAWPLFSVGGYLLAKPSVFYGLLVCISWTIVVAFCAFNIIVMAKAKVVCTVEIPPAKAVPNLTGQVFPNLLLFRLMVAYKMETI